MERNIVHIANNPEFKDMYAVLHDITYSTRGNKELKLSLILPWSCLYGDKTKIELRPVIVFIQGSGWTIPEYGPQLPQMCKIAEKGYVVAMVGHSDAREGWQFPTYLEDVKCAIRFLRAHANEYGIDASRVSAIGTSSGGNTAMLIGLTGNNELYKTKEYSEYSDAVDAVVECFGPMDLESMYETWRINKDIWDEYEETWRGLYSKDEAYRKKQIHEMSPIYHGERGQKYPPFLILHGTADTLVDFSQLEKLYDHLVEINATFDAYAVDNAPHESNFWGNEVFEVIVNFVKQHLK